MLVWVHLLLGFFTQLLEALGINMITPITIAIWHRDGISAYGKVYRNGELAKTDGKWEHITVAIEKTELEQECVRYRNGDLKCSDKNNCCEVCISELSK